MGRTRITEVLSISAGPGRCWGTSRAFPGPSGCSSSGPSSPTELLAPAATTTRSTTPASPPAP